VVAIAQHLVVRAFVVASGQARGAADAAETGLQHDPRTRWHVEARRRDHFAGDVAARDVRQRNRDPWQASSLPEVQMIQRAGANAHQRLTRRRDRIRRVLVAQDLGTAVLMEANSLHGQ
jgi:hypothetical protein